MPADDEYLGIDRVFASDQHVHKYSFPTIGEAEAGMSRSGSLSSAESITFAVNSSGVTPGKHSSRTSDGCCPGPRRSPCALCEQGCNSLDACTARPSCASSSRACSTSEERERSCGGGTAGPAVDLAEPLRRLSPTRGDPGSCLHTIAQWTAPRRRLRPACCDTGAGSEAIQRVHAAERPTRGPARSLLDGCASRADRAHSLWYDAARTPCPTDEPSCTHDAHGELEPGDIVPLLGPAAVGTEAAGGRWDPAGWGVACKSGCCPECGAEGLNALQLCPTCHPEMYSTGAAERRLVACVLADLQLSTTPQGAQERPQNAGRDAASIDSADRSSSGAGVPQHGCGTGSPPASTQMSGVRGCGNIAAGACVATEAGPLAVEPTPPCDTCNGPTSLRRGVLVCVRKDCASRAVSETVHGSPSASLARGNAATHGRPQRDIASSASASACASTQSLAIDTHQPAAQTPEPSPPATALQAYIERAAAAAASCKNTVASSSTRPRHAALASNSAAASAEMVASQQGAAAAINVVRSSTDAATQQ